MTTRQLAEQIDVVPATILMYEQNKHPIPFDVANALANVLDIKADLLYDDFAVFLSTPYNKALKDIRMSMGMSQREFAEHIGVIPSYYYKLESGYEDELRQQIEMLENECVRHEQTINSLLNMISSDIPTESQFAFDSVMNSVQAMLAHTKMELQELKRKLSFLLEVESTTSGLFNAAIQLLAVVTNVIAAAEICINGSETPLDSNLSIVIENSQNELIVDNLDEMLQSELGIDMDTYKEVYGEEKVKELEQYVMMPNLKGEI